MPDLEAIKASYRKRFLVNLAMIPLLIPVVMSLQASRHGGAPGPLSLGTAVLFVGVAAVVSIVTWRCPSCGASLGKRVYPAACHRCGVELR